MNKQKVIIGMSGGVDSSVAAAILLEKGYEVIGLTMDLWGEASSFDDAKFVCSELGIRHIVADFRKDFEKHVIDYFTSEYTLGRTPNPCIACNKALKFDAMLRHAESLGADFIATGHYAKIEKTGDRFLLKKSNATKKDQTYVLYSLTQSTLSKILMPLGDIEDKNETRKIAESLGLITARKSESMEICFIPDNDYASFISRRTGIPNKEGNFVDMSGNVLGRHKGIINYTIGQRKGLGIAFGKPMFVIRINARDNEIVLGEKGSEFSSSLIADGLNFIPFDNIENPIEVCAKVRYTAKEAPATVTPLADGRVRVDFSSPQRAITPGQAVVFYSPEGDAVIGGGIIQGA